MPRVIAPTLSLTFEPLTAKRWADLEALFGERGACGGCWCMWWRLRRSLFNAQKGAKNRAAFRRIVADAEQAPGVLAYHDGKPIGWCAIAPREEYPALERSRVLSPVDVMPVWSITCLFVARPYRGSGVSVRLIEAATKHAATSGARIVEGYPIEPREKVMPAAFAWTGLVAAFRRAGFEEVVRRSPTRPIMRFEIGKKKR